MSDAALSKRRAAALESSARSDAMKPAGANKAGRGGRADVRTSDPATRMETSGARKTWRS
jgi:hypothetical protein